MKIFEIEDEKQKKRVVAIEDIFDLMDQMERFYGVSERETSRNWYRFKREMVQANNAEEQKKKD